MRSSDLSSGNLICPRRWPLSRSRTIPKRSQMERPCTSHLADFSLFLTHRSLRCGNSAMFMFISAKCLSPIRNKSSCPLGLNLCAAWSNPPTYIPPPPVNRSSGMKISRPCVRPLDNSYRPRYKISSNKALPSGAKSSMGTPI